MKSLAARRKDEDRRHRVVLAVINALNTTGPLSLSRARNARLEAVARRGTGIGAKNQWTLLLLEGDPSRFIHNARMPRSTFIALVRELQAVQLPKSRVLSPQSQVLLFLRWIGYLTSNEELQERFQVSGNTVSTTQYNVLHVLLLAHRRIRGSLSGQRAPSQEQSECNDMNAVLVRRRQCSKAGEPSCGRWPCEARHSASRGSRVQCEVRVQSMQRQPGAGSARR